MLFRDREATVTNLTSKAKTTVVNKGRVQISKDLWFKKKEQNEKKVAFETDKQKYFFPRLNLPLDLKTENAGKAQLNIQSKKLLFYKLGSPHS